MKKVTAIGELLIDFVPQQKGCALKEVTHFERVANIFVMCWPAMA